MSFWITVNPNTTINGPFGDESAFPPPDVRVLSSDEKSFCDTVSKDHPLIVNGDGNVLRYATYQERINYAPTLRDALTLCFAQITDPSIFARFWPLKVTLEDMNDDSWCPQQSMKTLISSVDISDLSAEYQAIKTQLLSVPQWTV